MKRQESRRLRCKAKAKGSGEQCRNWAREGHEVCRMHGVGGTARVEAGERKDPTTTNLRHGLFAKRARGLIATRARHYEGLDPSEMFDLRKQGAVLWAALELADESGKYDDVARLVATLGRVSGQHTRLQQAGTKMVPEAQVVGLIAGTLGWLAEIISDPDVPRDQIQPRLAQRLLEFARKLGDVAE